MSVALIVKVRRRSWNGYREQAFPTGYWIGAGRVEGDGTGGTALFVAVFNPGSAQKVNQWYSLEQLTMFDFENAPRAISVEANNFDDDILGIKAWMVNSFSAGANAAIALQDSRAGIFLGNQRASGTQLDIRLTKSNAAFNWDVIMEGYIWGPRSLSAPGGFQRPPTGIYSART